ncbi:hypothetical protein OROGR_005965 [Orobanche gracilis]
MTDRVSPPAKPNGTTNHPTPAAAAVPIPNPPSTKAHLYNPTRHPYRPTPTSRHRHKHDRRFSCRRCFCITCFWSVLILIAILLLAAIAAASFYALYHPRRPTFSITFLRISAFNLTTTVDDSAHLNARMNITLVTRNTNKKITYYYDPISINVVLQSKKSLVLSSGSSANFTTSPNNISVIHTALARSNLISDPNDVNSLKSDLKRKRGLPMEIVMDTMVGVKMEKLNVKKIGIRIKCGVIHGLVAKGKKVTPANTANAKCKVVPRIKIWKWTFLL